MPDMLLMAQHRTSNTDQSKIPNIALLGSTSGNILAEFRGCHSALSTKNSSSDAVLSIIS
jgi:hypothetical protein